MEVQLTKMYAKNKMLRQIHTKSSGCVKAAFTIEPDLPAKLRVGVFSEPKKYNAWVRFSNANTKKPRDKKKDVRGVAIKLMDVPGEKLLPDERLRKTQDFLLMSSETYFSQNIITFSPTLAAFTSENHLRIALYVLNPLHWKRLSVISKSMIPCDHPCNIPYWSTQPYQFGEPTSAVKYFLRPSPDNNIVIANTSDNDFLRVNLAQTLNNNEISFDFCVQFQEDAESMPIENPTIAWTSPFIKLATLKLIPQSFDSNAQNEFAENLSFNIWHSLPAHKPLGNFNRARKIIYLALSKFRHKNNNVTPFEPTDSENFLETNYKVNPDSKSDPKIPTSGVVSKTVEIIVNCSKETAFKYISGNDKLADWLKKSGPVAGAKNIEVINGPYSKRGATRRCNFEDGNSVLEELLTYNPFANYSYVITEFTSPFKKFSEKAFARLWFDTVDDKTRIRWTYSFTYRNFAARLIISLFMDLFFKKYMQNALNNAKAQIEKK